MTPVLFLVVALAGGLGAVARFMLDGAIRSRVGTRMPWGTLTINLSGSFALGLIVGLVGAGAFGGEWQWALGTGFLGGYTTFSTASFETVRLLQERRLGAGLVNALAQLVAATALAGLGLWLGGLA
ncbi:fluoride efflux transporter CrcB [Protaetiibacter intestinalis]|uniref:Fluoride-specific ion channel FluC n=1 Tax=Protaetiibacter intestinalis TaxID=2419774 RepID=A0A387B5E4_9MICO|nr:fluoride efflux transporter CrcB [Protaetiibacter intestinalis]AYF96931.1 fluoride efflux transporter CrcB [Protaetiibacter intestinalis]